MKEQKNKPRYRLEYNEFDKCDYLIDTLTNNRQNLYSISEEEAKERLKSLIKCRNCIDCVNCEYCEKCDYCFDCKRSFKCKDCNFCNDCLNCEDCENLERQVRTFKNNLTF